MGILGMNQIKDKHHMSKSTFRESKGPTSQSPGSTCCKLWGAAGGTCGASGAGGGGGAGDKEGRRR